MLHLVSPSSLPQFVAKFWIGSRSSRVGPPVVKLTTCYRIHYSCCQRASSPWNWREKLQLEICQASAFLFCTPYRAPPWNALGLCPRLLASLTPNPGMTYRVTDWPCSGSHQIPRLFPDHFAIPWLLHVFRVSGSPWTYCCQVHLRAVCLQPFGSNVISWADDVAWTVGSCWQYVTSFDVCHKGTCWLLQGPTSFAGMSSGPVAMVDPEASGRPLTEALRVEFTADGADAGLASLPLLQSTIELLL